MPGVKEIILVFNYGGMPHSESLAGMKLFAKEVLPVLKKMPTPVLTAEGQEASAAAVSAS